MILQLNLVYLGDTPLFAPSPERPKPPPPPTTFSEEVMLCSVSPPFFHRDFWPVLEERSFSTYTYKLSHFVARRCTCMKTMIRYRVRIFGFCKKSLDVFRILRIQAILSWRVWVVHRMRDLAGSLAQVRTLSPVARDASIHFLLSDSSD